VQSFCGPECIGGIQQKQTGYQIAAAIGLSGAATVERRRIRLAVTGSLLFIDSSFAEQNFHGEPRQDSCSNVLSTCN
jgi:hypothetical protein